MELHEAIRRRTMVRSFASDPIESEVIERLLTAALRAPTAGNTGGTAWIALQGAETATYWDTTTDEAWRAQSRRFEALRRAPVVLLAFASPAAYVARYGEQDKVDATAASLHLDAGDERWPVPYWIGDAAFGVMTVLLAAVDAGLGACVLGNFRGEADLAGSLGVPADWHLFSAVLLGRPDGRDQRSPSLDRTVPNATDRIHWGAW